MKTKLTYVLPLLRVGDDCTLSLAFADTSQADTGLEVLLDMARTAPGQLARLVENAALDGMNHLNREAGPEHSKQTGRKAGGGTLVKGS